MRGSSGTGGSDRRHVGAAARAAAKAAVVCVLLASCNNFSMTGLLDTPPSGGSTQLRLQPDAVNVPVNGTRRFTAGGGSGGYTYSVEAGGAGGSIDTKGLYSAPARPGTDSVLVTDSTGSESTAMAIVVPATSLLVTPTTTTVNAGSSVEFTPSGGSGIYAWSLAGPGTLVGSVYTAPWAPGTAKIRVTDSTLAWREATVTVRAPTAVQISPSTISLHAHGSVTFAATGGSGSYVYSADSGSGSLAGATYTAPWSAETATIRVRDARTTGTALAAVTVSAPPPLQISPSSANIDDSQPVTFTASGGSGSAANYSYTVTSGPGSLAGSVYTPPFGVDGDAVIRVKDAATLQTSSAAVHITAPAGLAVNPSAITIEAGAGTVLAAAGGSPPYTFAMISGGGTLVGAAYTAPWAAGSAVIRVTDGALQVADATVTVKSPPPLVISPAATTVTILQGLTFTGSGGSGAQASFSYTLLSGGGTLVGATYTAPGAATSAVIRLTDSLTLQTRDAAVTVNPPAPLTITPASVTMLVGDTVTFSPGGGSGRYSLSVVSGSGTMSGTTYTAVSPETSLIRLADAVTLTTLDATIVSYDPLTVVPGLANVPAGAACLLGALGGVPPYAWSVAAGTGSIDPVTGLFTAPSFAETDDVKVTDSLGNVSAASVTVAPATSWALQSIDVNAASGLYASLALGGSGKPSITYYEANAKELRLATWNGTSWAVQTVDTAGPVGRYTSLALEPASGYPRISYYDSRHRRLRYAAWNGTAWSLQTVASGNVGMYTSLALEPGTGYPRISYYDSWNRDLKYAAWSGTTWVTQTVDSGGDVGMYTSLALDPASGMPRISYYDSTNTRLKYAVWSGARWVIEVVDGGGDVGMYDSLALSPSTGQPRISYYDNLNKHLKYASWNGTSWVVQAVDIAADVGMYSSLALEPGTGLPRISYFDNANQGLKFAAAVGGGWVIESVDTAVGAGSFSSLKLDPAFPYAPRIAYSNSASQDLRYAAKP